MANQQPSTTVDETFDLAASGSSADAAPVRLEKSIKLKRLIDEVISGELRRSRFDAWEIDILLEIWTWIAKDSVELADRVDAELREVFEALARMPHQGHRREDLTQRPVLFFPLYSYLIVYQPRLILSASWLCFAVLATSSDS